MKKWAPLAMMFMTSMAFAWPNIGDVTSVPETIYSNSTSVILTIYDADPSHAFDGDAQVYFGTHDPNGPSPNGCGGLLKPIPSATTPYDGIYNNGNPVPIGYDPTHATSIGNQINITIPAACYSTPGVYYAAVYNTSWNQYSQNPRLIVVNAPDGETILPPQAFGQSVSAGYNSPTFITLSAADPNNLPLTYHVSAPSHGTLSGTAPHLTYTPFSNYSGSDNFTFQVSNGSLMSESATIILTVASPLPGKDPKGFLDLATCTTISGWACDEDNYAQALTVQIWDGLPNGGGNYLGNAIASESANVGVQAICGDVATHGFTYTLSPALQDGLSHQIYVKALNIGGSGTDQIIANSPQSTERCAPQTIQTVVTPELSPNGGTFESSVLVTLTCATAGANIYYTTDGSAPTTASILYSGPFTASATMTVRAKAVLSGMNDSAEKNAIFTVTAAPPPPPPPAPEPLQIVNHHLTDVKNNIVISPLLAGTTVVNIIVNTNIHATCSIPMNVGFNTVSIPLTNNSPTEMWTTLTGLYDGLSNSSYAIFCEDTSNTSNKTSTTVVLDVQQSVTPPAPTARADVYTTFLNTPLPITLTGTDPSHLPLTFALTSAPLHGSLSGNSPNFTYVPQSNYIGPDAFTFKANNGFLDSEPATITIAVSAQKPRACPALSLGSNSAHVQTATVSAAAAPVSTTMAPDRVIVKFKSSMSTSPVTLIKNGQPFYRAMANQSHSIDTLNAKFHVKAAQAVAPSVPGNAPDVGNIFILKTESGIDVNQAVQAYASDPNVAYAQPDYVMKANAVVSDPYYASAGSWGQAYDDLWGVKKLQMDQAWPMTQGKGVVVAVVDSGLDYHHPDISGNVLMLPGSDVTTCALWDAAGAKCLQTKTPGDDPIDHYGHGTHVAGIIGAMSNSQGIIGVAPQAQILPVKALNDQGFGYSSDLAAGILFAVQHGARVINNSWSCEGDNCASNPVEEDAIRTAYRAGVINVFAAGNSYSDASYISPQNMVDSKPIVVASSDHNDMKTDFSNCGDPVDIAAPGGDSGSVCNDTSIPNILSLRAAGTDLYEGVTCGPIPHTLAGQMIVGTSYTRLRGTSMSAPYVSGAVALMIAMHPDFSPEQIRALLKSSADQTGQVGLGPTVGRLNVYAALTAATPTASVITSPVFDAVINGQQSSVAITGTASGSGFDHYELAYAAAPSYNVWTPINNPISKSVSNGVLGLWSLQGITGNRYALRLRVVSTSGLSTDNIVQVFIDKALQVTTSPVKPLYPTVSDGRIVWVDSRDTNANLYTLNNPMGQSTQITRGSINSRVPALYKNVIAYGDSRNGLSNLFVYDFSTATEKQLTSGASNVYSVKISGSQVAYVDAGTGSAYVYLYDLAQGIKKQITDGDASTTSLAIDGNTLVYFKLQNAQTGLYAYDIAAQTEQKILNIPFYNPAELGISGTRIVWEDNNPGQQRAVFLYDLSNKNLTQITHIPGTNFHPVISGNYVAWQDGRYNGPTIFAYDIGAQQERQITAAVSHQQNPSISGNQLIWLDDRTGTQQIFMYSLTGNTLTLPPVSIGQDVSIAVTGLSSLPPSLAISSKINVQVSGDWAALNWSITPIGTYPSVAHAQDNRIFSEGSTMHVITHTAYLDLAPLHLAAGSYDIQVYATSNSGLPSPAVSVTVTLVPDEAPSLRVYPNPWRADLSSVRHVTFDGLPAGSSVKLFTLSGHIVKSYAAPNGRVEWNLTNESGDDVASGIYFYLITDNQDHKTRGKIIIIR